MIEYKVEVMVMMPDNTWHLQTQVFTQEDEGDEAARQKALLLTKANYEATAYVDMTIYSFNAEEIELDDKVWIVVWRDYEGVEIVRVFDNEESAQQYVKVNPRVLDVEEWSVWS